MTSVSNILTRFDNEIAINLVLSINCNLYNIVLMISFTFLLFLVTSFSIETGKVMYFSVFSTKQVNYLSNSSATSFMIKW